MQDGYSTASENVLRKGFGAGRGFSNIKSYSDRLYIDSAVGKGTRIELHFILTLTNAVNVMIELGLQVKFERRMKYLVRPTKWRRVEFIPNKQCFVPLDIEAGDLEENILRIEELESIRLKDLEGLEQEECAEKMEVSRQTFQRILNTARAKIADSLINAKAIRIEGGNYTRNICLVKCLGCGKIWEESFENFEKVLNGEYHCPDCSAKKIICARSEKKKFCRRNCWRHGKEGEFKRV